MNRNNLGSAAKLLVIIGIWTNFLGIAILLFWSFNVMIWGFGGFGLLFSPFIKAPFGCVMPLFGVAAVTPQKRRIGGTILAVSGGLTIPPMMISDPVILAWQLAVFGAWPLVPHIIGGSLLIAAGALAFFWLPSSSLGTTTFLSSSDTSPPAVSAPPPGGYCPACGGSLFGDEKFCPRCAHPLRRDQPGT